MDTRNRFSVLQTSHEDSIPVGANSADHSDDLKVRRKKVAEDASSTVSKSASITSVQNGLNPPTSCPGKCVTKVSDSDTPSDVPGDSSLLTSKKCKQFPGQKRPPSIKNFVHRMQTLSVLSHCHHYHNP